LNILTGAGAGSGAGAGVGWQDELIATTIIYDDELFNWMCEWKRENF
jgi:hypothetical protein